MSEKKYIITESQLVDLLHPDSRQTSVLSKLKPVEPVAIAEGRELYWIANKKPLDDEKDVFLFPLEN